MDYGNNIFRGLKTSACVLGACLLVYIGSESVKLYQDYREFHNGERYSQRSRKMINICSEGALWMTIPAFLAGGICCALQMKRKKGLEDSV